MDRVLDKLHGAGIQAIVGTPTYSIPPWLAKKHPDILVLRYTSAPPLSDPYMPSYLGTATPGAYGPRQNMDLTHPEYRRHAERVIRAVVGHVIRHPAVIGFQVDNETGPNGLALPNVQKAFVDRLKEKYGTPAKLNELWGLTYWGQLVQDWNEFPSREGILNPGYKLEWERFQQQIVTDFLAWQARIVRELKRPDQFVTHNFVGGIRTNLDQWTIMRGLDIAGVNPYHAWQDAFEPGALWLSGDLARSLKGRPYLVTETNAQTIGWDSRAQYPPYDGQLRLAAYSHFAAGATMVAYWHWHSLHYGQETYWKGLLSHDLEPNRVYEEAARIGGELKKLGGDMVITRKDNKVAILYSGDSYHAVQFMPFSDRANTMTVLNQFHAVLGQLQTEADIVTPECDWSAYKVLLTPPLYAASDEVLKKLAAFVERGGQAIVAFKSGFANEHSTVRWQMAPGPLRKAAGIRYQEFTNLAKPLALRTELGQGFTASAWAEYLVPETAEVVARYEHPFLSRFPAVTRNRHGQGVLVYEGTLVSNDLQRALVKEALQRAGIGAENADLRTVHVRHGWNAKGQRLHYFLNYGGSAATAPYRHGNGRDMLSGKVVTTGGSLALEPYGVAIVREE
jgi:beta-galactosidase